MQKSKEGRIRNHSGHLDHLEQNKPPAAVNIDDMLDEDIGDISSSSEIEIDEPLGKFATLFPLRGGIVFITEDGSTDTATQILYGPYLILGVFGSYMF